MCLMAYFCPLRHMRTNWWSFIPQFLPVTPTPKIHLRARDHADIQKHFWSWSELYSSQIYILMFYPADPQNMAVIGDRAFKEIIIKVISLLLLLLLLSHFSRVRLCATP